MSLQDMPTPGTTQWNKWFQAQTPDVKQTVLWTFGYQDANTLPGDATAGGFAPQLDPNSYDLSSMFDAPVDYNSKGDVLPFGLDQAAQTTNVIQDRNSLLPDNVIAALSGSGAYDTSAFSPTYEPQGNPIQATGTRTLQAMAQDPGGGWQSFVAQKILNGSTPSSAIAQLKAVVMAPPNDTADKNAQAARTVLINSLPTKYQTDQYGAPSTATVDYSTPQGFANAFDEKSINDGANDLFTKVMSDPSVGYTDPDTGLEYAGAKKVDSPSTQWFQKYGLPTPVESYSDPTHIKDYQDSVSPVSDDEMNAYYQEHQAAQDNQATAKTGFDDAQSQLQQLLAKMGGPVSATKSDGKLNFYGDSGDMRASQGMGGGASPMRTAQSAGFGKPVSMADLQAAMAQANQQGGAGSQWHEGNLQTGRKPGFYTPQQDQNAQLGAAQGKVKSTTSGLQDAYARSRASENLPDDMMQRVLAAMTMKRLADSGRTPLQDALQQRMLTIRNQGVLGY